MSLNFASYLANGYTADQILQLVERIFPNISRAAKSAKQTGKSAEEIVRILSNLNPKQLKKADKRAENLNFDNPLERATQAARSQENNPILQGAKDIGKAGLLAAGAYGAARALPAIAGLGQSAIEGQQTTIPKTPYESTIQPSMQEGIQQPVLPEGPTIPIKNLQQILAKNTPTQVQPAQGQSQQQSQQPISQVSPSSFSIENSISTIKQMGLEDKISNLFNAGNNAEQIAVAVNATLNPNQKKWFGEQLKSGQTKPLQELIGDFLSPEGQRISSREKIESIIPEQKQKITEKVLGKEEPKSFQEQMEKDIQEMEVPKKGAVVSTPNGIIGNIESIRNEEALVKDDFGKLHKVKVDDLIESPLPEKDLADLYEDLIRGIEKETEQDVSRMVNYAGYDPNTNELVFLPHDGSLYVYGDISPEEREELTNILNKRKTSGENFIGAWKAGSSSPIGSAMSSLIKKLQAKRGGKGKEYSKKYETVYHAFEPAVKAAKHKKKKKRPHER